MTMKKLLSYLGLQNLTFKQGLIVAYFTISLCLLFVGDETPFWVTAIIVLNFANSARLIQKVPLKDIES